MQYGAFPTIGDIAQKSLIRSDFGISVREATRLMNENNVSSLVIEAGADRFVFSVEDQLSYMRNGGDSAALLNSFPLRRIASMPSNERMLVLLEFMERSQQHYMGVTDESNRLIGIVTYTDIMTSIDPAILLEKKMIGDLMMRIDTLMFTPDWMLEDVIHHFQKMEDSIIVVEGMIPVGIITTKDVFRILSSGGNTERPLREFMTGSVITIPTTASINEALTQLKQYRIKRAIVVSAEGYLLGVITQSQLVGYAYGSWIHILRNHTSELQELAEMLQVKTRNVAVLAVTDVLTGLGNQRLLLQVIREECNRIVRYHAASFSLLIIGIDHFEQINEVCGHMVGDDVLKSIGKLLKETLRLTDLVVRWDGEAFAVMLCNTPLANAVAFSSRLTMLLGNSVFSNKCRVTVSIGVGEYLNGEAEHELILRVENALSRAQRLGHNRVEQA